MFLVLHYKRRGRNGMLQRKGGYCYLPFVLYSFYTGMQCFYIEQGDHGQWEDV